MNSAWHVDYSQPQFDRENYDQLTHEWLELYSKNPRHWSLTWVAHGVSCFLFGKPLVITDIWRNDPASTHFTWRATDIRIYSPLRDVPEELEGLYPNEVHELADTLNDTYQYIRSDGLPSNVLIIHGEGLNLHGHLQSPGGKQWLA